MASDLTFLFVTFFKSSFFSLNPAKRSLMFILSYHTGVFHKFCKSCMLNPLAVVMVDACSIQYRWHYCSAIHCRYIPLNEHYCQSVQEKDIQKLSKCFLYKITGQLKRCRLKLVFHSPCSLFGECYKMQRMITVIQY